MALFIADRVKETTTTTSTGTYALAGAVDGFQSFVAVGNGNTTYYACTDGTDYEVGIGSFTLSGNTLTRVTILESSNSDNAVSWGAGTKEIFVTVPAEKYLVRDASGNVSLIGNLTISGTVDGRDVSADGSKLDGIESDATADQTTAQIRAKVEAASDSNVFTDADHSKLNGIEAGATGDQTNAEIRAAVEAASDSNVFTDADHSKLNGIEANAKNDQTITAGGGLTGGGTGDVTVSHSDTSSVSSTDNSGNTFVQDLTFDTYGHVTAVGTGSVSVGDGTLTVQGTGALGGSGTFTANQSGNTTISISHDDTSSQASVNGSGRTYIQDVTLDAYGHVTGLATATETVVNTDTNTTNFNVQANGGTQVNISAGEEINFINGNATTAAVTNQANPTVTFHHNDTSSQGSVNNSDNTVIQDVTLDSYGHVTGLTSKALSIPSAANDATITLSAGTGLSGGGNFTTNQSSAETITFNLEAPYTYIDTATGNYGTIKVDDDRGVSWAGYAIRDDWVLMSDGATNVGIYNDTDNEWAIKCIRNAEVELYHNGSLKLETSSNGIEMSGRIDMNNNDIYGCDQLFHHGDTNTYMQFHSADQWRVVVGGSERLEVKNSSPHVLVSGDLNSTSDERLKKNVKPIDNALADICQLEGVTFDWKDTGTQGQGFIAQQVEPIIPDVVNTDEDTGIKSINYVGLIGHLVEAIKTQQTQIDNLKAEIQSMKS